MLKRTYSGALALLLGLLAVGFIAPAANASEAKNVTYCQATASTTNPYVKITASENSVVANDGTLKQGGVNAGDIIPPFDYNFGGNDHGTFAGQNWTTENQTLWRNGCNPATTILTPNLPTAPIQTCANPNPTFSVPTPPAGINVSTTSDNKGNYTVTYELPKNTVHNTYTFPEGFVKDIIVATIDNRPLDAMWDATKGACNMPDTGAGDIKSEHVLWAGILIFSGLMLTTIVRRRTA